MSSAQVVGRLAPSPTGSLHLGHALSFLAAWWKARSAQGGIILRLEDMDGSRAAQSHMDATLRDLEWLGLDWDGAPIIQSQRIDPLRDAALSLLERGRAYPCTCTRGMLSQSQVSAEEVGGAPQAGSQEARYLGHCRERFSSIEAAEQEDGRPAGLRLRVNDVNTSFIDGVYGVHSLNVAEQVGDFLILRRNKLPAYQLAVVVDDHLDGVTEVLRGRDLLDSSARQILVAEALGFKSPAYFHLPLVCDHTGRRLAKREADLGLCDLRDAGVSAKAIVAWVAHALGQEDVPPRLTATELMGSFDVTRVPHADIRLSERPLSDFATSRERN